MSIFEDLPHPEDPRFAALGTVRQGHSPWPEDKPFPWSDAECAAFIRGHFVQWPLTMNDFLESFPCSAEMLDGYLVAQR
jgi:hypothetical protein